MHELSIAISLIEAAEEEIGRLGDVQVHAIHLRIGRLSGVVREALEFSYEVASQNTRLAGSRLTIEEVPVLIDCPECKAPREIVSLESFRCMICGAPGGAVLQGRELQVSGLEITEEAVSRA